MLTCVVLPVKDIYEIESLADTLRQAKRNGIELLPEVADWLDWAEIVLMEDECSIGVSSGINVAIRTT